MLLSQIVALTARVGAALDPELSPPRPSKSVIAAQIALANYRAAIQRGYRFSAWLM